ncbi:MAG: hypothetical protein ACFFD1_06180 [Candidatus Thorarchaeota archaeon]
MPRKMKGKGQVADIVKKELAKALIPVITKELVKGVEKGIKKIRGRGLRPAGRGLKLAGQGRGGRARMSGGVYVPSQLKGLVSIAPPPHKKRPRAHGLPKRKGRRKKN